MLPLHIGSLWGTKRVRNVSCWQMRNHFPPIGTFPINRQNCLRLPDLMQLGLPLGESKTPQEFLKLP